MFENNSWISVNLLKNMEKLKNDKDTCDVILRVKKATTTGRRFGAQGRLGRLLARLRRGSEKVSNIVSPQSRSPSWLINSTLIKPRSNAKIAKNLFWNEMSKKDEKSFNEQHYLEIKPRDPSTGTNRSKKRI